MQLKLIAKGRPSTSPASDPVPGAFHGRTTWMPSPGRVVPGDCAGVSQNDSRRPRSSSRGMDRFAQRRQPLPVAPPHHAPPGDQTNENVGVLPHPTSARPHHNLNRPRPLLIAPPLAHPCCSQPWAWQSCRRQRRRHHQSPPTWNCPRCCRANGSARSKESSLPHCGACGRIRAFWVSSCSCSLAGEGPSQAVVGALASVSVTQASDTLPTTEESHNCKSQNSRKKTTSQCEQWWCQLGRVSRALVGSRAGLGRLGADCVIRVRWASSALLSHQTGGLLVGQRPHLLW